jgi:ribose 5-phosphate isomerase B
MIIYLGADHAGYNLKQQILAWLKATGYQVTDLGATELVPDDDYPLIAATVAQTVVKDQAAHKSAIGLLFCASGAGVTIAANKIPGIRAVDLTDEKSARHARSDNDANIAAFAGDWLTVDQVKVLIATFMATPFSQAERHVRRLQQIQALETNT